MMKLTRKELNHDVAEYVASYLSGLEAVRSRKTMAAALQRLATELSPGTSAVRLPWHRLHPAEVSALRARLASQYAPATVNQYLAALRGVLRSAWRCGKMSHEAYQRASDVRSLKGTRLPAGREIARDELTRLFASLSDDATAAGVRDAALLAVAYMCGLRRAELAGLMLADFDGSAVRVIGKGDKERLAVLPPAAVRLLSRWLAVRGSAPGALFPAIRYGSVDSELRPMSGEAVRQILQRRAAVVGIDGIRPHDMRRTFVTGLLRAGVDLPLASRMAGHANVATTARYDVRQQDDAREAAGKLWVPMPAA